MGKLSEIKSPLSPDLLKQEMQNWLCALKSTKLVIIKSILSDLGL